MIDKVRASALEVAEQIPDGASLAIGGFGVTGIPFDIIDAICDLGRTDLHVISNNAGIDERAIGRMVLEKRVRKFTGSFPAFPEFHQQFMRGEVEIELVPQGTFTERLRAAGAGIPAFYTPTSVGTVLQAGGYPSKRDAGGNPIEFMPPKDVRVFDGKAAVLEYALKPDFALVKANQGDRLGNLVFRGTAENFNLVCAMAAETTIAEVRYVEQVGQIDPDLVDVPGIFVDHVVLATEGPVDRAAVERRHQEMGVKL